MGARVLNKEAISLMSIMTAEELAAHAVDLRAELAAERERAELAAERERTERVRKAINAALRVVNPVTHYNTYRMLLDAIAVIDRDGGQAHQARSSVTPRQCDRAGCALFFDHDGGCLDASGRSPPVTPERTK